MTIHTNIYIYIYIYIYIRVCVCVCKCMNEEMVDFGKYDKIKISVKVDKSTMTTDSAMIFRSLFKKELLEEFF